MNAEAGDVAAQADEEPTVKLPPGLARTILFEHFSEHCAAWADQPHPTLHGETPRKIATTANGRARVEALICDMEHLARGTPVAEACDFERLRSELGLGLAAGSGPGKTGGFERFWR